MRLRLPYQPLRQSHPNNYNDKILILLKSLFCLQVSLSISQGNSDNISRVRSVEITASGEIKQTAIVVWVHHVINLKTRLQAL